MVHKDLYKTLNIPQSADTDGIRKAYRILALRYHPEKAPDAVAAELFQEIAEAFVVLANSKLRAIYDQYGYEGLQNGAPEGATGFTDPFTFHGDAMRVFRDFFAVENPFHEIFPSQDEYGLASNPDLQRTRRKQDQPLERDLNVSLEEAYLGCVKKMKISRKVLSDDGHTTSVKDKILTIQVKPGWKEGTRITFPKDGDQGPNNIPSDLVFVLKYKPHPRFSRVGMDLVHTASVTLADALTGCIIELVTLDGRKLSLPVNDMIRPGYEMRIPNEGMPHTKAPTKKGDLILRFNILFPHSLNEERRALVRQALL